MRVKNTTQRFQLFVQDLQESFWGDFQGRMREMLKKLLESNAEQQMANYLGLKWHERAQPAERLLGIATNDCRSGHTHGCKRDSWRNLSRSRDSPIINLYAPKNSWADFLIFVVLDTVEHVFIVPRSKITRRTTTTPDIQMACRVR